MKNVQVPAGTLTLENVVAEHIKLIEACQLHATWVSMEDVVVEDTTTTMDRRITSKYIHNLTGSATSEEALVILKANYDKKRVYVDVAASKNEEKKKKKARETTTQVLLGSELLEKIQNGGPQVLRNLKVDELHALLINASPQELISKPSKKVGLEKVAALATVKEALSFFAANAPLPPPTFNATVPSPPRFSEPDRKSVV